MKSQVTILAALVPVLFALVPTRPGNAAPREEVLEVLEQVVAARPDDRLRVWVNDGENLPLETGTTIEFHIQSRDDVHLTALYLDAEGNLVMLYPAPEGTPLRGNQRLDLETFLATTPYGLESLFVVGSPQPITRESLGVDSADQYAVIGEDAAVQVVQRLRDIVAQGGVPGARVDLHIVPAQETGQGLTRGGIVRYFTEATRSLHRPKLALDINFESNSADLEDDARKDLDVVGLALSDERLGDKRFRLVGHTDHQGDAGYNMALSKSRAASAREYLVENYEIDPSRLDFEGEGESSPMLNGQDERAMRRNRRVELELIR